MRVVDRGLCQLRCGPQEIYCWSTFGTPNISYVPMACGVSSLDTSFLFLTRLCWCDGRSLWRAVSEGHEQDGTDRGSGAAFEENLSEPFLDEGRITGCRSVSSDCKCKNHMNILKAPYVACTEPSSRKFKLSRV